MNRRIPIRLVVSTCAWILLAVFTVSADSTVSASTDSALTMERADSIRMGYPVRVDGDTLFSLEAGAGRFSASERALVVSRRLQELAGDSGLNQDSIRILTAGGMRLIVHRDQILFAVTPDDARGRNQDSMARAWRGAVLEAVTGKHAAEKRWNLLVRAAVGALILLLTLLAEWALLRLARRVRAGIGRLAAKGRLPAFRIQQVSLLTPRRLQEMLLKMFRAVVVAGHVLIAYASLLLLFFVFPWTRSWGHAILTATLAPFVSAFQGFVGFIPDLLHIVVIVGLAHFFLRLLRRLVAEVENGNLVIPGFYADWGRPTFNIFRFLFYAFVLVIIFPYLPGSDSPVFKGVTVFLGIMVSVGSSAAFSNIVAGIVMTYMRSFRLGDRVQVGEIIGDVTEKTLLVTRIKTFHGETVTMPNSALLAGNTVNYTVAAHGQGLLLHTQVTIGYDVPWRTVHALLIDAARKTPGVIASQEPFVLQKALNDFYVAYEINLYTLEPARMNFIYSDLHQNIQDRFFAAGVEIMSPHYRAVRDGSAAAVPPGSPGAAA